eukprot:TRINITY_DN4433_c0_g1_i10.p1 TRINITY_DN4433_c0_g1~~TRINITY_DN4433_c0_g1_i10.p1  ORF type:complete len:181 (-),score=32.23 TRINITY_DN4433_c0_g1_i10:336-878(-)
MASQPSTSRGGIRRRNRVYNLREAVELVQTEGSDVEEHQEYEDSDFSPSEGGESVENTSDSEGEETQARGVGVGVGVISDTDSGSGDSDGGAQADDPLANLTEEEFLRFMTKDWHEDFTYFPAVPPYTGHQTHGLKLGRMTRHAPIDFFHQIFDEQLPSAHYLHSVGFLIVIFVENSPFL